MKDNKTTRVLNLLLFLGSKPNSTKKEIMEKLKLDERTFFNYLREIRDAGFLLKCKSGKYFLDKTNDNVKNFSTIINFSCEEEFLISSAINSLNISNNKKNKLYNKVNFLYNNDISKLISNNRLKKLTEAAQNKNQVIIKGYSNENFLLKNFQCEVYAFDNDLEHCWCFVNEINKNAKLKISDIARITVSPIKWIYIDNHLDIECDSLGDYGIRNQAVNIFMNNIATTNLINQYPMTEKIIKKTEHNLYQYATNICKYSTITEFILFNLENIKYIEPLELKTYISKWIKKTSKSFTEKEYVI